jgi:hypothetical protein
MTKEEIDKLAIIYKGNNIGYLNPTLIKKNSITDNEIEELKRLHCIKAHIFEQMEKTDDPKLLKSFAKDVTETEFALQKTWRFIPDETMHEWYKVPKCQCSKMDNAERRGTKYQVINGNCPVHGSAE